LSDKWNPLNPSLEERRQRERARVEASRLTRPAQLKLMALFMVFLAALAVIVIVLADNDVTFSSGKATSALPPNVPSSPGIFGVIATAPTGVAPPAPHVTDEIEADKIGAWAACATFVEERLKAPLTADLQSYSQELVSEGAPGSFEVHGTVDAQNSYGARLRSKFKCTLHDDRGGKWILDFISIQ